MGKYNHHFANHFGSCRLIATGWDPHRNRDIQLHLIPGELECVGVTDGVDAWVAPIATPFLSDVHKALQALWKGEDVRFPILLPKQRPGGDPAPRRPRQRVSLDEEPEIAPRERTRRPRASIDETPAPRRARASI